MPPSRQRRRWADRRAQPRTRDLTVQESDLDGEALGNNAGLCWHWFVSGRCVQLGGGGAGGNKSP